MSRDEEFLLRDKYNGQKTEGFLADCNRLAKGEPLGYIIGWIPFLDSKIFLDSHPLIPRQETEFWVEKAISTHLVRKGTSSTILDLCAGSGCIGVSVLAHMKDAHVDFVEIDEQHHETISKNVRENGINSSHARIFGGDLFENVTGTYDLILTNPPYIDATLGRVADEVLQHEPSRALFGGKDGTEIIERIIANAGKHLAEGGILYMEHEPEQSAFLNVIAPKYGLMAETRRDQYDVFRYTRFTRTGEVSV